MSSRLLGYPGVRFKDAAVTRSDVQKAYQQYMSAVESAQGTPIGSAARRQADEMLRRFNELNAQWKASGSKDASSSGRVLGNNKMPKGFASGINKIMQKKYGVKRNPSEGLSEAEHEQFEFYEKYSGSGSGGGGIQDTKK